MREESGVRFWMPRATHARGKVHGALPRTPARGTPPETPGRLSLLLHLAERSSPSRVRCAAHKPRALDGSGPFRRFHWEKRKAANANPAFTTFLRLPLVGAEPMQNCERKEAWRRIASLPPPGSFLDEKMLSPPRTTMPLFLLHNL